MKTAFVTGATGDIGRANIAALVEDGWRIAAADLNIERIQAIADDFPAGSILPLACDITSAESVGRATATALDAFGGVRLLLNGAGGISAPSLRSTTEMEWSLDLERNLTGHWRCIHALQEQMIARRDGIIINIASVNGLGIFGHPGYSVAKAGLIHLTRFIAVELGKFGIRAVAICPGSVRTQAWDARVAEDSGLLERVSNAYPSRAICEPADVAAAVRHAASDAARMMNGAIIALDGGLTSGSDQLASMFTGSEGV